MTNKLGFKYDEVKTNKNSTMTLTPMARPFSGEELTILQGYIDRGYSLFRKRVADGRHLKVEDVEKIAQGRVWLGNDALGIKLVDAIGSLDDAIKKAAELAKLKEYHATNYPEPEDWWISLLEKANGKGSYIDNEMRQALGEYYEPLRLVKTINHQSAIQARLPYYLNIN